MIQEQIRKMARWLHRVMSAGRRETGLLLALVVLAGGSWAYIEIAESVHGNKTRQIDESILLALREPGRPDDPLGPIWAEQLARDLTALGSLGVLSLLTILSSCFLVLKRKNRTAVLLLTAVATGMLMSVALKMGADRPRPNLVPHLTWAMSTSFPSGHAMTSAVTYLTLGSLLARAAAQRREKAFFLGAAVLISWIVGFSRVYLGVHWPTDVLAGWTAGAIWAFLWWLIARRLQQRGEVERESPL